MKKLIALASVAMLIGACAKDDNGSEESDLYPKKLIMTDSQGGRKVQALTFSGGKLVRIEDIEGDEAHRDVSTRTYQGNLLVHSTWGDKSENTEDTFTYEDGHIKINKQIYRTEYGGEEKDDPIHKKISNITYTYHYNGGKLSGWTKEEDTKSTVTLGGTSTTTTEKRTTEYTLAYINDLEVKVTQEKTASSEAEYTKVYFDKSGAVLAYDWLASDGVTVDRRTEYTYGQGANWLNTVSEPAVMTHPYLVYGQEGYAINNVNLLLTEKEYWKGTLLKDTKIDYFYDHRNRLVKTIETIKTRNSELSQWKERTVTTEYEY